MTILWDWNGTLLSDVPLVVKINNEVFARHGYRLTSEEEYRRIFRFPVKDYYTDIGVTDEDFPLVAKEWNEGYVANFHLAQLHQTAAEAVHRFHDAGFHQAIISASQVDQLRAQVVKFPELNGMFDDILGAGRRLCGVEGAAGEGLPFAQGLRPGGHGVSGRHEPRRRGCPRHRLPLSADFRRAPVRRGAASGAGR